MSTKIAMKRRCFRIKMLPAELGVFAGEDGVDKNSLNSRTIPTNILVAVLPDLFFRARERPKNGRHNKLNFKYSTLQILNFSYNTHCFLLVRSNVIIVIFRNHSC